MRGFGIHAIEGIREELVIASVQMGTTKCLGAPSQDPNRPLLPYYVMVPIYYLMAAIEADEKKRESERKEQLAAARRQKQERNLGDRGGRGGRPFRGGVISLRLDNGRGDSSTNCQLSQ